MQANFNKTDLVCFKGCIQDLHIGSDTVKEQPTSRVLGLILDWSLKFSTQFKISNALIHSKWEQLRPFISAGLSVEACLRILRMAIIPAACYNSHLWDYNNKLSVYGCLKESLRAPFNPPAEFLHLFTEIPQTAVRHSALRLSLVRQLLKGETWRGDLLLRKGPLVSALKADLASFLGRSQSSNIQFDMFSKGARVKFMSIKKLSSWNAFVSRNGASLGMMGFLPVGHLSHSPIPLGYPPRVVGALCSLVTGHCMLQEHVYKLGLSFTPTCVCLTGDESVAHFLFDCPLYVNLRKELVLTEWSSVCRYVTDSGRLF